MKRKSNEDWRGIPILMTRDDVHVAWATALIVTGLVLFAVALS